MTAEISCLICFAIKNSISQEVLLERFGASAIWRAQQKHEEDRPQDQTPNHRPNRRRRVRAEAVKECLLVGRAFNHGAGLARPRQVSRICRLDAPWTPKIWGTLDCSVGYSFVALFAANGAGGRIAFVGGCDPAGAYGLPPPTASGA